MPAKSNRKATLARRAALFVAAGAVALFAIQGGEWGTFDLLSQRSRMKRLEAAVDSLQHAVDSLKLYRKRIDSDPALQERIAREEFGMVRGNKELLYRFTEPLRDTSRRPD
ncbi:MAG: septum formation initiator family protein [Gemmatimonadetes bacterium]|nr:septum formation initiator family protein [Gemmatimonadota bacterium]